MKRRIGIFGLLICGVMLLFAGCPGKQPSEEDIKKEIIESEEFQEIEENEEDTSDSMFLRSLRESEEERQKNIPPASEHQDPEEYAKMEEAVREAMIEGGIERASRELPLEELRKQKLPIKESGSINDAGNLEGFQDLGEFLALYSDSELKRVKRIALFSEGFQRISGLERVPNLEHLYLGRNNIKSLDGVEKAPGLTELGMEDNPVPTQKSSGQHFS